MPNRIKLFELSRVSLVIIIGAIVKFALHMYIAPGYGFFFDELYTIALSRHLAFGYVDLPPLVPALVALSRFTVGGIIVCDAYRTRARRLVYIGFRVPDHKRIRWKNVCCCADRAWIHYRSRLVDGRFYFLL